jgi:hypothetical protein
MVSPRRPSSIVLAVLVATLTLLVAGCGGGGGSAAPAESPGTFITRILSEELHGQWAQQWTELHPGHQKLITQAQYVACSRSLGTDIATGKEVFHVLAIEDRPIHVRDVPQRTSKLVTITVHQRGEASGLTYRLHAVAVGGRWTWILGNRFLDELAHGRCLDGSKLVAHA